MPDAVAIKPPLRKGVIARINHPHVGHAQVHQGVRSAMVIAMPQIELARTLVWAIADHPFMRG